jgi:cytosine/adenosine deaminase-related metal-dependent hydrolase
MNNLLLVISAVFMSLQSSAQQYTLIRNVTVADVVNQKLIPAQDILIKDSVIFQVGKNLKPPANAKLIDGKGRYTVPGLIDAHVHFFQSGSLFTRPDAINLNTLKPYSEEIVWTKEHVYEQMLRYLACGVTGVVDCGGPFWNFDVRDLSRKSALAPHLAVAGPLISTYSPPNLDTLDPPIIKVTTPEAAAALVRKQIPYKPDFIKVWYIVLKGETPVQYLPIFRAVVA